MKIKEILTHKYFITLKPLINMVVLSSFCELLIWLCLFTACNPENVNNQETYFMLFILLLILFALTYRQFSKQLSEYIEERISNIRLKVIDKVRNTDFKSFEQIGPEILYTSLTFDIKSISEISHLIAFIIRACTRVLVSLIYLAYLSFTAFWITGLLAGLVLCFYINNQVLIKQIVHDVRNKEKELFEAIKHQLFGFKELRINDKKSDDFFYNTLILQCEELKKLKIKATGHFTNNYSYSYIFWKSLMISVVLILPLLGIFTSNILFIFIGIILLLPISFMVENIPPIVLASISIQRLIKLENRLDNINTEETVNIDKANQVKIFENLNFSNISYIYDDIHGRPFSLGPLSMNIKAGEIIFITGGNGSGKSSLLKLITGLYYIRSGKITLNKNEIKMHEHKYLFSTIFSDFFLFDRFYGIDYVNEKEVNRYLKQMKLENKVEFKNKKFSSLDLSTGQKKRLALICSIIEDKNLYVFDEWAADQDPYFREYFYKYILKEFKKNGKTVIAVTHDDAYFHVADKLYHMDYGQLYEKKQTKLDSKRKLV